MQYSICGWWGKGEGSRGGGRGGGRVGGGEGGDGEHNWNNIHFSNNRQAEEDELYLLTFSPQHIPTETNVSCPPLTCTNTCSTLL